MRYEKAIQLASAFTGKHPCHRIVFVGNGVSMLQELRLPVPAWTVPALSWLIILQHEGDPQPRIMLSGLDEGPGMNDKAIAETLAAAGFYRGSHAEMRKGWERHTIKTYRCPVHE